MKFRGLTSWSNPKESEGLLFLAQLLEELLFDYSLDTYKPSAMNSSALCKEALSLIKDIEEDLIDKSNLPHVLKELALNLRKDEVAGSLLSIRIDSIINKFENKDTPIEEISTILKIIYSQISLQTYKDRTEELLIEAVKNAKEKDRIRSLTRNYVTTLINFGYSTRFLYPAARMFFHWDKKKVEGPESLKDFFKIVAGTPQSYTAIFIVNSLFSEIKESCKAFDVEVTTELDKELNEFAKSKAFNFSGDSAYLIVKKIQAMDVFSARDIAERQIDTISTLCSLFHHKESPEWEPNALLINHESKKARMVLGSPNPMLMCSDSKRENAAIKLNTFINTFNVKEFESLVRFHRAAELHALALKSDSPENQLLSLWVALETIVPSKLSRTKAKVNNVIDSILPFLSLTYIETLTDRLTRDFNLWNRPKFLKAIENVKGESERQRLLFLLILPDYKSEKDKLYIDLQYFHLLRNRAHYFSEVLSSTKKISSLLENHWQRVDWQVRRIYRTRNLIVHSGSTPPYMNVLIKNIHDYLDVVMTAINRLASDGEKINTLDEAFKYSEMAYFDYMHDLSTVSGSITRENIDQLLIKARI